MHLNFKNYQKLKIKKHLKKNTFLLFSIGANQNTQSWINLEQGLYKLKLNYHKTYNNIIIKIIQNSIYKNLVNIINSTFFCLTPKANDLIKTNVTQILKSVSFTVLSVKLNNQIYAISQLKNINSLACKNNRSIMYQFLLTNFRLSYNLAYKTTISKQCDSNT